MITHFHIENFKSLVDFDLPDKNHELSGFTCLIGLNGAGKSTLLQAFEFVTQIIQGTVNSWLNNRGWKSSELVTNLGKKSWVIALHVQYRSDDGKLVEWGAKFNTRLLRCTQEWILKDNISLLKVLDGSYSVAYGEKDASDTSQNKIQFAYEGSILSALKLDGMPHVLAEVKSTLLEIRSLELLSPQYMHSNSRDPSADDIGRGGERLASYLRKLSADQISELRVNLINFFPQLQNLDVNTLRFGWHKLRAQESYEGNPYTEARHLNDGLLRIIAILAQGSSTKHKFLLFDEIENGFNPVLVEKLVDFLIDLRKQNKQVVVTTHSPVILNFLEDVVARDSVIYIYKTKSGKTHACRFFDQPETGYKLKLLGPGEVFVDTDLVAMTSRLSKEVEDAERFKSQEDLR